MKPMSPDRSTDAWRQKVRTGSACPSNPTAPPRIGQTGQKYAKVIADPARQPDWDGNDNRAQATTADKLSTSIDRLGERV